MRNYHYRQASQAHDYPCSSITNMDLPRRLSTINEKKSLLGSTKRLYTLKGVCNEILYLWFFRQLTPSGPLINQQNYFLIWFRLYGDIHTFLNLSSALCSRQSNQLKFADISLLHHAADSHCCQ